MAEQDVGEPKNNNKLYIIIGSVVFAIVLLLVIIFMLPSNPLGKLSDKDVENISKSVSRYSFVDPTTIKDASPASGDKDTPKEPLNLTHVMVFKVINAIWMQFKKGDTDVNSPAMMVYKSLENDLTVINEKFVDGINDAVINARSILFEDSKVKVDDIISIIMTPYEQIRNEYYAKKKEIAENNINLPEDKKKSAEEELKETNDMKSLLFAKVLIKYLFNLTGLPTDMRFFEDVENGYSTEKYFEPVLNNMSSEIKSISESKISVRYGDAKTKVTSVINYIFVATSEMASMLKTPHVTESIFSAILTERAGSIPLTDSIKQLQHAAQAKKPAK
ncbi:hypothetical protein CWI42_012440 [Ordospora colligata]|uniref:Uncharacterized protein n=1 Tax=Ordospora colligata OC4 TaxID=1354746 RepID=A0A0B2UMI0_9MICR|nr:uncharacterized protein M896_012440 [Ordospora colligata OC4]KHN70588.1 hypothetical protein M896_012440 [Ordospora colligata OC4]TBU17338.1 hypothetical protein CWI41_012440 [Ordospora colligata]TBU17588.1 hypothetical protein CWI40_012440 [Ordospora colligata]TBU19768.1 hypothetical protein CWI42_012440 [Ordospora colligata]